MRSSTQKVLVLDFILLHLEEVRHTAMNGVLDLGESVQTHLLSKGRQARIVDLLSLLNKVLEQKRTSVWSRSSILAMRSSFSRSFLLICNWFG